jgi:hypothetical protein
MVCPILAFCGIVENCKKKAFFLNAYGRPQWKESKDDDGVSNRRQQSFSCVQCLCDNNKSQQLTNQMLLSMAGWLSTSVNQSNAPFLYSSQVLVLAQSPRTLIAIVSSISKLDGASLGDTEGLTGTD